MADGAGNAGLAGADRLDQLPHGQRPAVERGEQGHLGGLQRQAGIGNDLRCAALHPLGEALQPAAEEDRTQIAENVGRHDDFHIMLYIK